MESLSIVGGIIKVAKAIVKAANEARQCKSRCRDLADRVKVIANLVQESEAACVCINRWIIRTCISWGRRLQLRHEEAKMLPAPCVVKDGTTRMGKQRQESASERQLRWASHRCPPRQGLLHRTGTGRRRHRALKIVNTPTPAPATTALFPTTIIIPLRKTPTPAPSCDVMCCRSVRNQDPERLLIAGKAAR